jgi:hypothetical protein
MPELSMQASLVFSEIVWGARERVVPVMIAGTLLSLLVLWSYWKTSLPRWLQALGVSLKWAAIWLLAICLLQPMENGTRPEPLANVVAIVADSSASMNVSPHPGGKTRISTIIQLLSPDQTWRQSLAELFDLRDYRFDSRLENATAETPVTGEGESSLIGTSMKVLADRLADKPVAAAVLFTDGNATDESELPDDWSTLGFPIYPVVPNAEVSIDDMRIDELTVSQTDFESAPVSISAAIEATGMAEHTVNVELFDLTTAKVVATQTVNVSADALPTRFRFEFRPESSGVQFYRMRASDQSDGPDQSTSQVEATRINNDRLIAVQRRHGPYRILYVAGRPNWEYKFIRRALDADQEIQLVGLLRIANKQPKFSFRDRGVSSTNPLFAGLGAEEEAAEQFDEPVILRLGVREQEELSHGFPDTPEELFAYHGIILDDLEASFFTQDQMLLLRRFVAERGGGLMMLGGQESFRDGAFDDSPLGDLSPVYTVSRTGFTGGDPVRFELTREGLLQPWARLRETELLETDRLKQIVPLRTFNPVGDVKPGASILGRAVAPDGTTLPALVVQRFGNGRTVAVPLGDLWRWSMRRNEEEQGDPEQAWRQWTRWLVGEVPKRTEVNIQPHRDPTLPTRISAVVRDEMFMPLDNADVQFEIQPLAGPQVTIRASADLERPGYYTAEFWTKETNAFRVTARVNGADGSPLPSDTSGWVSEPKAAEFERLQPNRELLEQMAVQSGGRVLRDKELAAFAAELPRQRVPVARAWVYPIWHQPWIMLVALTCLCLEWGLRRWKGLA